MGKSSQGKQEVNDYLMSLHYGICHGPVDALLEITVGEKSAWMGEAEAETSIAINNSNLFGGPKKEGGLLGTAHYLPGEDSQLMPSLLAGKLGRTPSTCPAYRGLASIFFHGGSQGFIWGANNPYLRSIWAKVRRAPHGLSTPLQMIGPDANPAAIIYECLRSTDWGMGAPADIIDHPSFESCAAALLEEGFGLSMQWTRQSTIEAFVSEVIDHIQATLFVNPRTGLLTLKLIRDDYDLDDLPVLDPTNCVVNKFDRKLFGETTNEIVVTWTNPANEQDETVSAQDLANITIQGGEIISDSRNYYGVRNVDLAMYLAKRDLSSAAAPLATFEIDVNREAWDFTPGGCVVLNYPEYEIEGMVLRIVKIDYGKPGQPKIGISAHEDIFSLPSAAYTVPDGSQWSDPSADPTPIDTVRVITAPTFFASAALDAANAEILDYPEVLAAVLASQAGNDVVAYDIAQVTTLPNGDQAGEVIASKPILGHCITTTALLAEATTLIESFPAIVGRTSPRLAGFLFIGATTEVYQEIALIQSIDEDGYLLKRGVLDTVPRAWPSGTPIWFVERDTDFLDTSAIRSAGEPVRYKLLTRTSRGQLAQADAPVIGATLTGRPHLPSRPANVTVGGASFNVVDLSATPPSTVDVTWSNRNRLLEDTVVLGWTDATVAPEAGQTTTIRVYHPNGTLLTTHAGLTGTSFSIPIASFDDYALGDVEVISVRDGLESLQGLRIRVKVRPFGFGDEWGEDWGGDGGGGVPPPEPPPGGGGDDPDPGTEFPTIPDWRFDELTMTP